MIDTEDASHRFKQPRFLLLQRLLGGAIVLLLALSGGTLLGQEKRDLTVLSVDDLMNVEVTSVSRKGQKMSETAAAVFVITQDDIHRSGATSIPEILRIVPGLNVARLNGNVWAVSARGFNGQYANKLLVMIDGRTVYTALFSGVYWDVQDTLLEDIDRIEVIRGPGGTLWGANAVNGIINIITKHAVETQGALVSAGAGAVDGSFAEARYGGSLGHNGYYRVFGKTLDRPASIGASAPSHDASALGRAGFRADFDSHHGDSFTAQGEIYRGTEATLGLFDPAHPFVDRSATDRVGGEDLLFRWTAVQSSRSDTKLQAVFDETGRSQPSFVSHRELLDIDFQNHLKLGSWNDAVWGAEYRISKDRADGPSLQLIRESSVQRLASVFVQDEIGVTRRLRVTLGTKLQHDATSHFQLQPTVRLLFKVSDTQSLWAAATNAVRTPSEIELYGRLTVGAFPLGGGKAGFIILTGNPELKPERVQSYEAGYRWQVSPRFDVDATAFHNRMTDLVVAAASRPSTDGSGQFAIPINFANNMRGNTDGAELLVSGSIVESWHVALGYSLFQSSRMISDVSSPRHQLQLRSFLRFPRQFELDVAAYYAGRNGNGLPSSLRFDSQLSWHPTKRWELSFSGQNLLHARHDEFVGVSAEAELATPLQRTVNGKILWRF